VGDEDPGIRACDCGLEVFGEPAATVEPGEGSFDDPTARQDLEALGGVGSFDDLKRPVPDFGHGLFELVASISPVGEDVA
jgi:hypothetical protein